MERKIIAAWIVGWLVYMVAMAVTVYDGGLSLIFQPIIAAAFATFAVLASCIVSFVFLWPNVWRAWCSAWFLAPTLIIGSILLVCFGTQWGLGEEYVDPETGESAVGPLPAVVLGCYLAIVFAVANWPETD